MADSQRKESARVAAVDDEAQTKKDRMMMLTFGVGAIVVVGIMWWLSTFLSG
jgi:predicted nucleic acid-binding Zn ribbon protein